MDEGGLFGDLPSAASAKKEPSQQDQQPETTPAAAAAPAPASKSLVESIGNAGTTFAFVPAALQRKKPASSSTAAAGSAPGTTRPRPAPPSQQQQQQLQPDTSNCKETSNQNIASVDTKPNKRQEEQRQDQEPEWLRQLHASVQPQDRYDPLVPNDYLAYRERLRAEQDQIQMEKAAKEQLEVQRRVRERIEEERRAAEEAGDVNRIVESRVGQSVAGSGGVGVGAGRGRGRGRGGPSNLPAWLVKKQKEESEKKGASSSGGDPSQFDDAVEHQRAATASFTPDILGRLVLLGNIDPADADNELADEVKEECEAKCGPVASVRVRPGRGEVSVYILFKSLDDASRTSAVFNGRSFGARRIWARLANRNDLF